MGPWFQAWSPVRTLPTGVTTGPLGATGAGRDRKLRLLLHIIGGAFNMVAVDVGDHWGLASGIEPRPYPSYTAALHCSHIEVAYDWDQLMQHTSVRLTRSLQRGIGPEWRPAASPHDYLRRLSGVAAPLVELGPGIPIPLANLGRHIPTAGDRGYQNPQVTLDPLIERARTCLAYTLICVGPHGCGAERPKAGGAQIQADPKVPGYTSTDRTVAATCWLLRRKRPTFRGCTSTDQVAVPINNKTLAPIASVV